MTSHQVFTSQNQPCLQTHSGVPWTEIATLKCALFVEPLRGGWSSEPPGAKPNGSSFIMPYWFGLMSLCYTNLCIQAKKLVKILEKLKPKLAWLNRLLLMLFYFQWVNKNTAGNGYASFLWILGQEWRNDTISKHGVFFASPDILFSELCSLLAVYGIYEKCSSHFESVCMRLSSHA